MTTTRDIASRYIPRSVACQVLGVSPSMLSYYLRTFKVTVHFFGPDIIVGGRKPREGMLYQTTVDELVALIRTRRRSPRRYGIAICYDTWEGYVQGWHVVDHQTDEKQGLFSRNHARYLADTWNRQAEAKEEEERRHRDGLAEERTPLAEERGREGALGSATPRINAGACS